MLTWLRDQITSKTQDFILAVLAAGPIPKHVAFVMDGNRRYARSNHKQIQQGHAEGFVVLRRMLEICLRLNVKCVSAYAFSIENFKRPPGEVDTLMGMAEEKLIELCDHGDLLDQYGVRLNVIGRIEMLPESVQIAVKKAESMTRRNDKAIFNLCMPYTSQDEITSAVQSCVRNAIENNTDITEHDIDRELMISRGGSPPLDILIRTSGVNRLSDFMLWQCCENTQLQFTSVYWPDFGLCDFIPIILDYQRKIWSSDKKVSSPVCVK